MGNAARACVAHGQACVSYVCTSVPRVQAFSCRMGMHACCMRKNACRMFKQACMQHAPAIPHPLTSPTRPLTPSPPMRASRSNHSLKLQATTNGKDWPTVWSVTGPKAPQSQWKQASAPLPATLKSDRRFAARWVHQGPGVDSCYFLIDRMTFPAAPPAANASDAAPPAAAAAGPPRPVLGGVKIDGMTINGGSTTSRSKGVRFPALKRREASEAEAHGNVVVDHSGGASEAALIAEVVVPVVVGACLVALAVIFRSRLTACCGRHPPIQDGISKV